MILSDTVEAEAKNEKMEELTKTQAEHIAPDGPKSSHPKRSNVVGLWRKREESIKALNVKSKEKAREVEFEEKKESNQDIEHDSRQQEKNHSTMVPHDSKTVGSERNAPEPTTDTTLCEIVDSNKSNTVSSAPRRSNIRDSWKKRTANIASVQTSQPSTTIEKTVDIMGTASEKSHASMNTRITESPSNTSTSAFNELKSKWAKFGVQKEDNPSTEGDGNQIAESELKEKSEQSLSNELQRSSSSDQKTQEVTKQDVKVYGSTHTSRAISSRRMDAKRFRSRHPRKPLTSSTSGTDEIMGLTKNASPATVDPIDSKTKISNPSKLTEESSSHSILLNEKELFPSFPLDEIIQNESDLRSNTGVKKDSGEVGDDINRAFVPIVPQFRDARLHTTASMRKSKDSMESQGDILKDVSIPAIDTNYDQDNINEVAPSGSWSEDVSNRKNSNTSRSPLSSRANRRLRDIRMRNQTRSEDDVEKKSEEIALNSPSGFSSSHGNIPMPMDESTAFSQSLITENASFSDAKDNQRSPLHSVVPDVNKMVPDEFFSEKDAFVESFKTAYDRTSFEQIANDMREEASCLFGVDILNEGVHSAINKFGFGDIFQTKSPRKVSKRAPSPVEEVAIEVEYVADSD